MLEHVILLLPEKYITTELTINFTSAMALFGLISLVLQESPGSRELRELLELLALLE